MTSVNVSPNNPVYAHDGGVLFDKQQKILVSYPGAKEGVYSIPEGVLAIGESAFADCSGLLGVSIPNSVTSIDGDAFGDCDALTSVNIPDSVTRIVKTAFKGSDNVTLSVMPGSFAERYAEENGIPYIYGVAEEERTDASGQWKYVLEDGVATITGYVEEPNGDLVIPGEVDGYPVTGIGNMAFEMCNGLTSVVIPDSAKSIGVAAFDYCKDLTSVTIPDSVTIIGDSAFYYCFGLTNVTIPDSVASIGSGAFLDCVSLTSVAIPCSVTSIGEEAFWGCEKLTLTVTEGSYAEQYAKDNGIAYIITEQYDKKGGTRMNRKTVLVFLFIAAMGLAVANGACAEELTDATGQRKYELEGGIATITGCVEEPSGDLVIPGELDRCPVTIIGVGAFDGGSLTSITIPVSVIYISRYAFAYEAGSLKSVNIPEGVAGIHGKAFDSCEGLTNITLPASLTHINGNPLPGCPLKQIDVSPANPAFEVVDGVLFDKLDNTLVTFPRDLHDEYEIPQGTAKIGDSAFEGCYNLTSVTIPGSVTSIGHGAFSACGLTDITIPGSVADIGSFAFWTCEELASATLLDGVASIGDEAFQFCESLARVTIPDSVTNIGDWAFEYCNDLVLAVVAGSYAEQYAKDNGIAYIIAE